MAFGQDETVPVWNDIGQIALAHYPEEQRGKNVRFGQGAPGMTHTGVMSGLQNKATDSFGFRRKVRRA
jgi:hypothetical protein